MWRCTLVMGILGACCELTAGAAEPSPAEKLAKAVSAMRKIDPAALSDKEKQAKGQELDEAWKTLNDAGPAGAAALKDELKKIEAAKERDNYFKLGAAAVLWQIGKAAEADTIAALWSGDVALTANYNYVFLTAFDAAQTQDPRVLPMLVAILRDKQGKFRVEEHAMTVEWPLSDVFLWGTFGSKGSPALLRVLGESKDETARTSAILLLARAQELDAIEPIRRLAMHGSGAVRNEAVKALGVFGCPQDYDFLVEGLKSRDPADAWNFAYALYEYGDLRAVPHLAALLSTEDEPLSEEVIAGLTHFSTPESIEALHRFGQSGKASERRKACDDAVSRVLRPLKLTYESYAAKTPDEKAKLLGSLRDRLEEKYRLKPDDRKLTHDDLLKAAAQWKTNHGLTAETTTGWRTATSWPRRPRPTFRSARGGRRLLRAPLRRVPGGDARHRANRPAHGPDAIPRGAGHLREGAAGKAAGAVDAASCRAIVGDSCHIGMKRQDAASTVRQCGPDQPINRLGSC